MEILEQARDRECAAQYRHAAYQYLRETGRLFKALHSLVAGLSHMADRYVPGDPVERAQWDALVARARAVLPDVAAPGATPGPRPREPVTTRARRLEDGRARSKARDCANAKLEALGVPDEARVLLRLACDLATPDDHASTLARLR